MSDDELKVLKLTRGWPIGTLTFLAIVEVLRECVYDHHVKWVDYVHGDATEEPTYGETIVVRNVKR